MALIDVQGITKVYRNGEVAVTALDDVTVAIERSEFVAVMGRSQWALLGKPARASGISITKGI